MITSPLREKLAQILQRKNALTPRYGMEFNPHEMPYDLSRMYPQYPKRHLEIGSGWGEFTLQRAAQAPTELFIALEKKRKRVLRCVKRQQQQGLENIRWMVLDVSWFFQGVFTPGTFHSITINFPDPWPKLRHQKHRFMSQELLNTLTEISHCGALLEFATDFYPYLEEVLLLLEHNRFWRNVHGPGVILPEIAGRPRSYFEELKRSEGAPVYFLQFVKDSAG